MKKLFLLLVTTATILKATMKKGNLGFTANGGTGTVNVSLKTDDGELINLHNVKFKTTKEGNQATGADYEVQAIFKELGKKKNEEKYALIKGKLTSFTAGNFTAQQCDANGELLSGNASENQATSPGETEEVSTEVNETAGAEA